MIINDIDLKEVGFFKGLNDSEIKDIVPYLQHASYKKREMVFSEGERSEWLYIVIEGKVKITKLSNEGKEIILELIQAKELFGAVAVFKDFPYPANAVAMDPTTALKVSRKDLLKLLDRYPTLMLSLASLIGDRMKDSYEMLKSIALECVESRIASLLLKLADKSAAPGGEEGSVIDLKLTRQDIADMVGTTVETSIRTLSKFKKEGLIIEHNGKVVIKNRIELQMYSQ
ncbi:MAG: Crp/Fnr family transcriptional regulator [Nitrospirae bacterium]|uniref:Crp/Fnr family transcriptional regulator n=1 Tax=Candidatus Magnetobacterium casense TaxID=1455061 RepID=UPI00058FBD41|nr:Crp/Fnr family transcriptional regulator [Candidatus Magnetobacterium casensis]MBF0338005.1 Crp/Fnr family transcriptional regulator [Nitrospirota bacterium]